MIEAVQDPAYWRKRLKDARKPHEAVFLCSEERWRKQEERHRQLLAEHVKPNDFVLDVGCGWGRLLTMMPQWWIGPYIGVDVSPDFIDKARQAHNTSKFVDSSGDAAFVCGDVGQYLVGYLSQSIDLAVLVSFRPMLLNHAPEAWTVIDKELKRVCKRRLFLEYVENDKGELER